MIDTISKFLTKNIVNIFSNIGIGITSISELKRLRHQSEYFSEEIVRNLVSGSRGVLHVGAHTGQEADQYFNLGVNVVWIEANPSSYERLLQNIGQYPAQKAILALVGSVQGESVNFQISSNDGLSSSLFRFGHKSGFPQLSMTHSLPLTINRLDNLLSSQEAQDLTHWVLDVQGAELLVLEGAGALLDHCFSLQVEVSLREVYSGGATWNEVNSFLIKRGFTAVLHPAPHSHQNVIFIRSRLNVS
jgi:FkbM family methyltransferase